ncbi:WAT1-related protein At1g43650 [Ziziphus jujuba]|uniref:WAT1-related protein n=2 Tax=Ziziphus jujuba TaxID=326968 RepID=A0A6P3ZGK0_ZIZJJ|nr:WAT1-related protein At1g43650 [Ziziphus jujuba]KAH7538346.1 hypothetical protein FEM48_Zijuj03G0189800 [Ziziphus jujuba var. spinosa]
MDMGFVKKWFKWSQIVLAMLMVQMFATGLQLLSRVILGQGTFIFALMAYRHVVAALCVAPLAFFFERKNPKKLSWTVWLWLFINSLIGITSAMSLYYYGLRDTTATYATNYLNLIPIVTFVLSTVTRIEKLNLHTRAGKIKTLGATLSVAGALTTSLYKGKALHLVHHSFNNTVNVKEVHENYVIGTLMLVGSCISYATWFIVQVKLMKIFPFRYTATMLACIIASLQSAAIGLCLDRRKAVWRLGWNLQLITILYSGALATAATFCLLTWAISKKGATYPSMFNPLTLIFVALLEAVILGQAIRVGTLIGMVLIAAGLYSYLCGRTKELEILAQLKVDNAENPISANAEPAGLQLTAIVMPSVSPDVEKAVGRK